MNTARNKSLMRYRNNKKDNTLWPWNRTDPSFPKALLLKKRKN